MEASLLYKSECALGEGPLWHAKRNSCFWVDIDGKRLYEYNWQTSAVQKWQLEQQPSLLVETNEDKLIIGLETGLASFDPDLSSLHPLVDIEKNIVTNRSNDGGCDCKGRLWMGTMAKDLTEGKGSLYCIDQDFRVTKKLTDLSIPNGLTWSADNKRMYFIDSPTQTIRSFLFDAGTGNIDFEKIVIEIDKKMGTPDGMVIDEEGMLWIAHYDGFGVCRWNPSTGKLIEKVTVPVPQVTCCVFGGEHLDHLIITTAREKMKGEDLQKYPDSGNVYVARVDVRGVAKYRFG